MTQLLITLSLFLASAPAPALHAPDGLAPDAAAEWEQTVRTLVGEFDGHLEDPGAYGRRVREQCRRFSEGELFPFTFPALAYGHIALQDPAYRGHARAQIGKGLAEWPDGKTRFEDMDSGPILLGVGLAASSLGLGAAIVAGDMPRLATLLGYMKRIGELLAGAAPQGSDDATVWIGGMIPTQKGYVTGFLYGDAALFLSLSWTDWGLK